ncbi:unnamed protein product [Clonostachys byssicola]|uniref:Rhodopsin domain-containing protein n=1 Tax=Clonostachys byssicola TaxID=160290 RepID=A0A9N9UMI4_9HYPO|nr:unnamed protein product [Clonostachys byssicola]
MSDMLEAPPGTFSHTGGRSTDVFLTAILLPVFSIPFVVLRLWTSKFIVRRWHPDDTLAMIATVGRWGGVPLYNLTTVFIKASILMFYQRFTANRALNVTIHAVLAVVIAYSLVNIIATFALDCSDPEECNRLFVAYIVCAALNVATDVAILLLPYWILRPLQTSTGRKIAIGIVLLGGGLYVFPNSEHTMLYANSASVSAVSILRPVITIQTDKEPDTTYAWGNSVKWSLIETWCGLICACLPCIKPALDRYFSRISSCKLFKKRGTSGYGEEIGSVSTV